MLKDYLLDVMQQHEHGLYMCELPTGNGKTYDSARAMKEYTDSIGNDTKIIYLTTLNKNLPEDALRAAYGSEELYKRNVLRLRSNFDEVVDKILEIEVPEEMKTDAYLKLCKDVSLYRNAVEKRYADKEYIKELADRITEGDRQLRYEITKRLKNRFQTKTQRKNAIRTDAKYKWIGKLYPAVFTDDYKIILMSVSKFMKRNSILIDSSYEFLNSDLIENAVIVIDEFDATKDTIQSELIDKSLAMQEDYIQLFRQIYRTLNPNDFSSSMRQAMDEVEKSGNRNTFTTLMDEARKIAENYHVRLIDGRYVLSDADKELGISKNMDIVFDIFSIDINSKKIINKLYEEMQQVAYSEKVYVKTQEIAQSIQRYILELEQETDYILTFTEDVDWMAIFKALRVQHEVIEEDYFEKLIRYIKVATVVMKYKIFVFVNLRSYLSDLQMQKLIQEAIYQEVKLIFVGNYVKDCMEGGLRYIIDRDQCEIY